MRIKAIFINIMIILFMFLNFNNAFPASAIRNAEIDYKSLMNHLRNTAIIIENFGGAELKKEFKETRNLFQNATMEYFAQDFISSYSKYYRVKESLNLLLEKLARIYLERSKEIMDSTSQQSFDIFIKYAKDNALAQNFAKPYNPVEEIKAYNEEEYHFFQDNEIIMNYMKNGYKNLGIAEKIFGDPDLLIIKEKEKKTARNLDYIMDRHVDVISYCRLAKMYGLEIHKIIKRNQLGDILNKYRLSENKLVPIYDDRIPEQYKVDANDNMDLIHSIELQKLSNPVKR